MTTLPVLLAAFLVFANASPLRAAEEKPAVREIITETEREYAKLRDAVKAKTEAVDGAITRAAKAGTLKISTEAYFREALDGFRLTDTGLELVRVYYPPRFDASEDMEPINKAWADLKQEIARVQESAGRMNTRLLEAAAAAVQTAGRTAERTEQLAEAEALVQALRKFAGGIRWPIVSPSRMSSDEALGRVIGAIRESLEASSKDDVRAVIAALQRVPASQSESSRLNFPQLTFTIESFWEEFRQRMARTFAGAEREAQIAVEKALIADRPVPELEALVAKYEARSAETEKLTRDPNQFGGPRPSSDEGRLGNLKNFRAVIAALEELKRDDPEILTPTYNQQLLLSDRMHGVTEEFRKFVPKLAARRAQHRTEVQAAIESKKREQTPEKQRAGEVNQAMAAVREKILALQTPQAARDLAETLPQILGRDTQELSVLYRDLLQLATWWADPTKPATESPGSEYNPSGITSAALEMRTLRERITREVLAERFAMPELRKPPLADLPVSVAVGKVADEAAELGEWKRVYELLRAVDSAPRMRGFPVESNTCMQAIHAYLSGQNFEKAEQFLEAIAAYQLVLQNVTDRVPTKEATERLKALKKAHPEAFPTPAAKSATSAPAGNRTRPPQN